MTFSATDRRRPLLILSAVAEISGLAGALQPAVRKTNVAILKRKSWDATGLPTTKLNA
jgi:hypothetical protein